MFCGGKLRDGIFLRSEQKIDLNIIRNITGVILRSSSGTGRIEAHLGTPDIRQPFRHLRQKLHPP